MLNQVVMPNDYRLGERVSFGAGGGAERYLLDGWSSQEDNHRWTDGGLARLYMRLAEVGDRDVLLRLRCKAFIVHGKVDRQVVEVSVNYRKVGTWTVTTEEWYEVLVPNARVKGGNMMVTLVVSQPCAPSELGLSDDTRRLGLYAIEMEVSESPHAPALDWRGGGVDSMGDVLFMDGNYFRAIRRDAVEHVKELRERGVFDRLVELKLIPAHSFVEIHHRKYAEVVMTPGAHWNVYPGHYVFLALLDAARIWLDINEQLLEMGADRDYGLIDGHYGNFALFGNSRPRWVDAGSIMANASTRDGGWFGIDNFVRSMVYPLLMFCHKPEKAEGIRDLMSHHYLGIPHHVFAEFVETETVLNFDEAAAAGLSRRDAMQIIRAHIKDLEYRGKDNIWSSYRDVTALELAASGRYLEEDQDSRFRAIIGLARRSGASTFLDLGANDGLFSILCAREGMIGIATDVYEAALNRLYEFLDSHPELEITVACEEFGVVEHCAELVMALALTHHLVLGQSISFSLVSQKLASVCEKALITEFMPDGLGGVPGHPEPSPNPLPGDYTLDSFLDTLRRHFAHVEVIDYERKDPLSRRVLIYCEKSPSSSR